MSPRPDAKIPVDLTSMTWIDEGSTNGQPAGSSGDGRLLLALAGGRPGGAAAGGSRAASVVADGAFTRGGGVADGAPTVGGDMATAPTSSGAVGRVRSSCGSADRQAERARTGPRTWTSLRAEIIGQGWTQILRLVVHGHSIESSSAHPIGHRRADLGLPGLLDLGGRSPG